MKAGALPTYDSYRDSGVDWLGSVPTSWKTKKLKFVTEITKRIAGREGPDVLSITQHGIKIKNVASGEGQLAEDYSKYQLVYRGDFAMNHMDLLTGYVDISKFDGVVSPDYRVFRCISGDLDDRYLLLIFQIGYKQRIFFRYGQGVSLLGRWRFPTENFKEFQVPIPSIPEQRAIAAFLDEKCAKIDEAVRITEEQIALLRERRQIMIQEAVTRGLNPRVPMKDSGVDWIGQIPAHWEVKKIKYVANLFRGKFTHRPRNDPSLYGGPYPFFQTGDVARAGMFLSEYKQTLNDRGLRVSTLIPRGTILITIAANIGDVAILDVDGCFPDSVVGFKPKKSVQRDFLYYSMSSMKQIFLNSSIANAQANLNVDRIGTISFCVPPLKEQQAIVTHIAASNQIVANAIGVKEEQIAALKEYKTSLINAAVTGKIKVV